MKRIIGIILIGVILVILTLINIFNHKNNDKLVVAEVTHSVFYAPWYVALENKYFDDLDIEVILTSGANNVVAAVISGDATIGLCGPEATIYAFKEAKDPVISFAGLTKRDGQFLVLRKGVKYDKFSDINGLTILAGRSGGMPLLNFKTALKNEKVNNVTIDSSVDFANLTSAFISGKADGVNLFEPNATKLVKEGYGFIATSIGTYSDVVPYTAFNAKRSFIKDNKTIINKFYKGINKGLDYVKNHNSEEIAKVIIKQFPDTSLNDLIIMVENYKKADSWLENANINEDMFNNLVNMLSSNNEINDNYNYKDLIFDINKY